jgi:hypothetical protein
VQQLLLAGSVVLLSVYRIKELTARSVFCPYFPRS